VALKSSGGWFEAGQLGGGFEANTDIDGATSNPAILLIRVLSDSHRTFCIWFLKRVLSDSHRELIFLGLSCLQQTIICFQRIMGNSVY